MNIYSRRMYIHHTFLYTAVVVDVVAVVLPPPTVVVFSVNGTRVFSALAAEWQISTFLTK